MLTRRYQQLFDEGHVKLSPADFQQRLAEFEQVRQRYIREFGDDILTPRLDQAQDILKDGRTRQQIYDDYLTEVGAIEVDILNHVDPVRLLMLGESTFEYSRALRQQLDQEGAVGGAFNITATSLQSRAQVENLISGKDMDIEPPQSGSNFTVQHEVDATKLHEHFEPDSFDRVMFNNPEASDTDTLITDTLTSASHVLRPNGEVHIGITGSPEAKGRRTLQRYLDDGEVEIGDRRYQITSVPNTEHPYAVSYPSRRTTGGRLRGARGPKRYFIFRLLP